MYLAVILGLAIGLAFVPYLHKRRLKKAKSNRSTLRRNAGLMNFEKRPPLSSEDRFRMLEVLGHSISNPMFYSTLNDELGKLNANGNLHRYNILQITAVHLASNFYAWRDLQSDESIVKDVSSLGNLIRDMLSDGDHQGRWEASDRSHRLAPLSDDEVRSLYQLKMFGSLFEKGQSANSERAAWTAGVAITEAFVRLQRVLEQWETVVAKKKNKTSGWLERVGGSDSAKHLLTDGWLPFLRSLERPDIRLWHDIVTEFHEFGSDRLEAAFWILEQPECDRLTAWHFIVGMVSWEVIDWDLKMQKERGETKFWDAFEAVLQRWNTEFYQYHSISYPQNEDGEGHHGFESDTILGLLTNLEAQLGLAPFTRPTSLDQNLGIPKDDCSRSVSVGLYFYSDVGLCLTTGRDWYQPNWHPNYLNQ